MRRLATPLMFLAASAIAVAALTAPPAAMAQAGAEAEAQEGPPKMPRPRFADNPPVLLNMILAVVLAFAVAAPNFIPSKRGHQD